jgi:hypothetical protein
MPEGGTTAAPKTLYILEGEAFEKICGWRAPGVLDHQGAGCPDGLKRWT